MPYKETDQHGPNFIEPPSDILEGKPEWEVKKILKERSFGHWKKKQYLVCWKGYLPAHDLWVNSEDLHAPELLADFQNQSRSIRTLHFDNSTPSSLCPTTLLPPNYQSYVYQQEESTIYTCKHIDWDGGISLFSTIITPGYATCHSWT